MFNRWVRFNSIGFIGVGVNLAVLGILTHHFQVNYILASILAVEAAVIHNFVWHQKWTWKDYPCDTGSVTLARLVKFHISNGLVSLIGNTLLIGFYVETFHLPVLAAGLAAIATCSLLNFLLSDYFVFRN